MQAVYSPGFLCIQSVLCFGTRFRDFRSGAAGSREREMFPSVGQLLPLLSGTSVNEEFILGQAFRHCRILYFYSLSVYINVLFLHLQTRVVYHHLFLLCQENIYFRV